MSSKRPKSKAKPIIYSLLAFLLAFALFLLSICSVLEATIFSEDYMINAMGSCGYYSMVEDELKSDMISLGNASGLDEDFSVNFVESLDIQTIEQDYISSFYSGDTTLVDTTAFKQQLYAAIDDYINEKGLDKNSVSSENLSYFVDQASERYVNQISIPFFSYIANYIYKLSTPMLIITVALAAFALIIAVIIFFTNKFKHRRYRYLGYGCGGAFLAVVIIPAVVFISGKISQINLNTRSLYNLFVNYANGLFAQFFIYAGILLVLTIICYFLYRKHYKKATSHH